jgi:hypothetical protein
VFTSLTVAALNHPTPLKECVPWSCESNNDCEGGFACSGDSECVEILFECDSHEECAEGTMCNVDSECVDEEWLYDCEQDQCEEKECVQDDQEYCTELTGWQQDQGNNVGFACDVESGRCERVQLDADTTEPPSQPDPETTEPPSQNPETTAEGEVPPVDPTQAPGSNNDNSAVEPVAPDAATTTDDQTAADGADVDSESKDADANALASSAGADGADSGPEFHVAFGYFAGFFGVRCPLLMPTPTLTLKPNLDSTL